MIIWAHISRVYPKKSTTITTEGFSKWGIRAIGLDEKCICGHADGEHDTKGQCCVLNCSCRSFLPKV